MLFDAEVIALLGLKILLRVENRSIDAMEFGSEIKDRLLS